MLSTLIIVFREVLEAAMVTGIAMIAAREIQNGNRWVLGGVAAGVIAALVVAQFANLIAGSLSGMGQEYFNAAVLLTAAMLMVWTAIWMQKHGRELSAQIRQTCRQVSEGNATRLMLAFIVALAVAREGSEVVLFLHGVAAGEGDAASMLGGGAAGLLLGLMVALLIYRSLIRIPLRYVFTVVTALIILLGAGMASQGVAYLVMVDALPSLGGMIWNSSAIVSGQSIIGQLLHALMGYDDRPSGIQALTFFGVLLLSWLAMQMQKRGAAGSAPAGVAVMLFAMLLLPADADAKKIYSPIVEQGEVELEYLLDYSIDGDPAKNGSARHQFELAYGVTDRWMTAIVGDFRKRPGQGFAYQGLKWENIWQIFEQGERWLDAGFYLEYIVPQKSLNKPDVIELKLLLEKETGRLVNTLNLVLKKELGVNAVNATTAGYAWRSKWRFMRELEPAIEIYGVLGELGNTNSLARQSHQIGPVLLGKLPGGFEYEIGYLFGLTSTSDQGMIKCVIGYEF